MDRQYLGRQPGPDHLSSRHHWCVRVQTEACTQMHCASMHRSLERARRQRDASGTDRVCYAHQPTTRTDEDASGVIQQATPACVPREHAPATRQKPHPTRSAAQRLGGCRPAQKGYRQALFPPETPRPVPFRTLRLGLGGCRPAPPPKGVQTRTGTTPSGDSPASTASHPICKRTRASFQTH
jgi:hypothetical protein